LKKLIKFRRGSSLKKLVGARSEGEGGPGSTTGEKKCREVSRNGKKGFFLRLSRRGNNPLATAKKLIALGYAATPSEGGIWKKEDRKRSRRAPPKNAFP